MVLPDIPLGKNVSVSQVTHLHLLTLLQVQAIFYPTAANLETHFVNEMLQMRKETKRVEREEDDIYYRRISFISLF